MLEELQRLVNLLFRLYCIERFPKEDLNNPHMLVRILSPMLILIGWSVTVEQNHLVVHRSRIEWKEIDDIPFR